MADAATTLRVRGRVQGVGFRPHVARVAEALTLQGWVKNDAEGVLIALRGTLADAERFKAVLLAELPPLARVDSVELTPDVPAAELEPPIDESFRILTSTLGAPRTEVAPDAAICEACAAEVRSPYEPRYRYPFASCTHCGPRFSIVTGIPYDRERTTLRDFPLCPACRAQYEDPSDRRFHAEPIACHVCGPKAWLERSDGRAFTWDRWSSLDMVDAAAGLLLEGQSLAVKGLGGFHLVCDATNAAAVETLRERKKRDHKPFALLARDLDVVRRYARVSDVEEAALRSTAAPIVLLEALERADEPERPIAGGVAPGLRSLGFMLPATPLQLLMLRRIDRPLVCTSGNLSDEPPAIDNEDARARLGKIADWFLFHERPIARRLDDSVARPMGGTVRVLRRARGYTPEPLPAPSGFERAPQVLALGGQLKSSFCLLDRGRAIPSAHHGDLDDARAFEDWQRGVETLTQLFEHRPELLAVDLHPDYRPTAVGVGLSRARKLPLERVQHHHAHIASVMFEHGHPLHGPPILGVALDGLGYGEDGELWGGEVLLARYEAFERVGTLKPVALLGGDAAAREPWRNLYAHLLAETSMGELLASYGEVEAVSRLAAKPRATLDAMLSSGSLAPRASSTGRLFDAVAAALGLHFERVSFEGQAAMELEALVDDAALREARASEPYPVAIPKLRGKGLPYFEPQGMWRAILGDLYEATPLPLIAARFHLALAEGVRALAALARKTNPELTTVALSGGVFQNRVLLEATLDTLTKDGFTVWTHAKIPPNDGGIAVGQCAVAAARALTASARQSS